MDMIGADESAAQVTDKIKDLLYAKSGEKVDAFRPHVANSLFGDQEVETEIGDEEQIETESELEVEDPQDQSEE